MGHPQGGNKKYCDEQGHDYREKWALNFKTTTWIANATVSKLSNSDTCVTRTIKQEKISAYYKQH